MMNCWCSLEGHIFFRIKKVDIYFIFSLSDVAITCGCTDGKIDRMNISQQKQPIVVNNKLLFTKVSRPMNFLILKSNIDGSFYMGALLPES